MSVLLEEQWKSISGFEGHYEVSNHGRVRSIKEGRIRVLKVWLPKKKRDYPNVTLSKRGKVRYRAVHNLVATEFIGPKPSYKHVVRHLDGDKLNLMVTNLAWGTSKENADDKALHGRVPRGEANPAARLTEASVREIRSLAKSGISQHELSRRFSVARCSISGIVHGTAWRHVL